MILDEYVEIKVTSRNMKYYEDLGYDVPKRYNKESYRTVYDIGKTFWVKTRDLSKGSGVMVHVQCDICKKKRVLKYKDYIKNESKHGYYACTECASHKRKDTFIERFGVDHPLKTKEIKDKIKNTCIEKYGYENVNQVPEYKEKIKQTCLERYGYTSIGLVPEIQAKVHETNIEKYGSPYVMGTDYFKDKSIEYYNKNYGVSHCSQVESISEKKKITSYKNGTCRTSNQQKYICDLYNGVLNKPFLNYNLDIFINDNIDVEIDFSGHDLCVRLGNMSEEEFKQKEIIRSNQIRRSGIKMIHYISETDKIPSDEVLMQILEFSKQYFDSTNHTWIEWYFDKNMYRNAENPQGSFFDLRDLHKLKNVF